MSHIYVDADACPVKEEVYRVAQRHGFPVTLVSNSTMRIPAHDWLRLEVVSDDYDAADDWIVAQVRPNDIVVTGDIPLAARCIEQQARVLGLKGRPFTEESIGGALAHREFLSQMREHGVMGGGPAPFEPRDRSRFLQALEAMAQACKRSVARGSKVAPREGIEPSSNA